MGTVNCLITSILQNILIYVQHKKETHTGFGTTWGWANDDNIFIFGWTIPLKNCFDTDKPDIATLSQPIVWVLRRGYGTVSNQWQMGQCPENLVFAVPLGDARDAEMENFNFKREYFQINYLY